MDSPEDGMDIDLDLGPEDLQPSVPLKKVPTGDLFEAARAGDCDRLALLLEGGANVNVRDRWDSVALYYACLAGHTDAARMLLEAGAVCVERTFDGDRCHYAALNLGLRRLLKAFEARPPPLPPLPAALRTTFLACPANRAAFLEMLQGSAGADAAALAEAAGFGPTNGVSTASLFPQILHSSCMENLLKLIGSFFESCKSIPCDTTATVLFLGTLRMQSHFIFFLLRCGQSVPGIF